ncbi:transketolase [Pestalotiopsis fici W106-1]|uniref:Transketolase n=1 Tax=Pestalotiopsis fici (strain W106-1 / CGMCC3.15140) TaxID=1229662 RepID=W3XK57_PESFW|nr:transketolase [Pestalotiopsis fici W106-1]ETS85847.1 transketolase [Pestalotiopsis fici W106-1]
MDNIKGVDGLAVNTLRALSADLSYHAKSGHPGAPMGMAPMAHVLFTKFLKLNPATNKAWLNRDRFVLSNGHACALQYVLLHLLEYDISIDDLKNFRQLGSKTPGHPESHETPGIEVTTGPLGQGFAAAIGLAIAQSHMAALYNRPGFDLFDNRTFVFFGDGCAMEGVASEAASLAGHLQLGNLIALYDDNSICIDGSTESTFTEDVDKRFEAYGWHVQRVTDGDSDLAAIAAAVENALAVKDKPSMIRVKTTIGYGSKLQGTASVHGNPLKVEDLETFKQKMKLSNELFFVPAEVQSIYRETAKSGAEAESRWNDLFLRYGNAHPELHLELQRRIGGDLPDCWETQLPVYTPNDKPVATRKTSEFVLDAIYAHIPEILSGSADLTSSNLTRWKTAVDLQAPVTGIGSFEGRYIRWGDKGAAMNGIAAYGANLIPIAGTFLNFVSYAAPALRLSALSQLRVIWIATHDSIGLGGDGPTHQPIETLAHFRSVPNLNVWRPADGNETSAAYYTALMSKTTPSVLALARQDLPQLSGSSREKAARGAYVLLEDEKAAITLVSTGSEVSLCLKAAALLSSTHDVKARVVSMPCMEVFDTQPLSYKLSVLTQGLPILSVEALSTNVWSKFSHEQFGINEFGLSGTADDLFKAFGFTAEGICERALQVIDFYRDVPAIRSPVLTAWNRNIALD